MDRDFCVARCRFDGSYDAWQVVTVSDKNPVGAIYLSRGHAREVAAALNAGEVHLEPGRLWPELRLARLSRHE